jgi:hypothetical protein
VEIQASSRAVTAAMTLEMVPVVLIGVVLTKT